MESDRFKNFSSYYRLKKSIALIQRMIERKRYNKEHNWRPQQGCRTVEELNKAEETILLKVRACQLLFGGNQDLTEARRKGRHVQQASPSS